MNKNTMLRKAGLALGIVAFFLVLAYGFVPGVLSGKVVNQSDISGYVGMSHEMKEFNAAHPDDPTLWTDAMFGGMPVTAFHASSAGNWTAALEKVLLTGKRPATWLFLSLLGGFLLMLALGVDLVPAVIGAVAVTFCSYNLQIIQVGHNSKMQALAFFPWVLAALVYTYRKARNGGPKWLLKTLFGAVLFALALSLQIKANHQQITYYLALVILIYAVTELVWLLADAERRRGFGRFAAASGLLLTVGLVGVGTNTVSLAPLYEYTKYTMRGGSELTAPDGKEISGSGLQLDYATAWSYGWEELPNLMIPNFNGGSSSGSIDPDKSATVQLFARAGQGNPDEIAKALPFYWGPQPFTAGPMYMGAITIFLFLLGLLLYDGREKWWLLAATLLAVALALGSHFMAFTRFFYDHVPMYNKFRTVSMALVVLQFTLPMLGILVLDRILKGAYTRKEFLSKGWIALGLTAGFCLLCAVAPGIAGDFSGGSDGRMQDVLVDALRTDRRHLLAADALRSALFIGAAFVLLLWGYSRPASAPKSYASDPHIGRARRLEAVAGIGLLILINLFAVGKRYLNADDFTTPRSFTARFNAREVDKQIKADPAPSYRVLDLTADVFNDSFASYHHKSVGGYSPAKMQRYQDLIDRYLTGEIQQVYGALQGAATVQEAEAALPETPVLDALNTKYLIIGAANPPLVNRNAFGPAWFVNEVRKTDSPDAEIAALGEVDLKHTAVLGPDFAEAADRVAACLAAAAPAPSDTLYMTSYAPNELHYHYVAATDRPAVFSEVFYPDGWKARLDGTDVETSLFRADWTLRGAVLPAGEHDIVFRFEPAIHARSERASRACSVTLFLLLLLSGGMLGAGEIKKKKSE